MSVFASIQHLSQVQLCSRFSSSLRSERRRVAITSSFQHRRRRVHAPSPAAFDDTTGNLGSQHPSRCGSAPHLDSEGVTYRPTVRPRQGSSIVTSPLLRRAARPSSCIVEEMPDDEDLLNHVGETTSPTTEIPRRATSTDRHRQPLYREHVGLPTHLENISTSEIRKSKPAQDEPAGYGSHQSEDVKTGNIPNKTAPDHDDPVWQRRHHSEKTETGGKSSGTVPARDEPFRHGKHHSEKLETGSRSTETKPMPSQDEPTSQGKRHSDSLKTGSTSSRPGTEGVSGSAVGARMESVRNNRSHSDDVKTGKNSTTASTSASSRPGRRVLPTVPTGDDAAKTVSGSASKSDRVHQERSSTSDVHHVRQLPRSDKCMPTERNHASSLSNQQKDPSLTKSSSAYSSHPNKPESSPASVSGHNKSRSSATTSADSEPQKTHNSKLSSNNASSSRSGNSTGVKSSADSVRTKLPASAKSSAIDHSSKSSGSSTKSPARNSSTSQKSPDSSKFSTRANSSQLKSAAAGGKADSTERVKSSSNQTESDIHVSVGSKSAHKDQHSQASAQQSRRSTGSEKSPPSASKSQSSKSTPVSGSRLTYKVNATTVQPVLMNDKKKQSSTNPGQRSPTETDTSNYKETTLTVNVNIWEQNDDSRTASSPYSNNFSEPGASTVSAGCDVSSLDKLNENHCSLPSGVDGDSSNEPSERQDPEKSVSQSPQTGVKSQTSDHHSPGPKHCIEKNLSRQKQAGSDSKTPTDADAANGENEDAKNSKKQQQWQDLMAMLEATRAKYSSAENRSPSSESSHPAPVYSDCITPCWRIQRDDFAVPTSVAIASDGSSVIADIANCLLDFIDVEGNVVHSVTGTKPFSVAIGANDMVYAGDRRSRTVRVFDLYGSDVAQWDAETTGFGWIAGIAMMCNGRLAIIDRERCKVSSKS